MGILGRPRAESMYALRYNSVGEYSLDLDQVPALRKRLTLDRRWQQQPFTALTHPCEKR